MKFSPNQSKALNAIAAWLADPHGKPTFYLAGPAGSGKSTITKYAVSGVRGRIVYCAPTGKAALVMRRKGCSGARTIHQVIYRPAGDPPSPEVIAKLREEIKRLYAVNDPGARATADKLVEQLKRSEEDSKRKGPRFSLNLESELKIAEVGVVDECFVAGTRVDTPRGAIAIEALRPGDEILNAAGGDRVKRVVRRKADQVVQIDASGTRFSCSPDHPFFTKRGLCRAGELEPGDQLLATGASMRLLRDALYTAPQFGEVLLSTVQHELVAALPRVQGETLHRRAESQVRRSAIALLGVWERESRERARAHPQPQAFNAAGGASENLCRAPRDEASASSQGRQWQASSETSSPAQGRARFGLADGARREDGYGCSAVSLQAGSRRPGTVDHDRDRWAIALSTEGAGGRSEEDRVADFLRVDCIEVIEQGDPRLDQYRDADGQLYLYDLEGTLHHSFSVEGILVHNCSMVDRIVGQDLESYGTKLLVIGDPNQLPPVYGAGYFTSREPDAYIDEIHRQALDSPILRLADLARRGKPLPVGSAGDGVDVRRYGDPSLEQRAMDAEMIIVGRNRTRHASNAKIRRLLGRADSPAPVPGDKVICRRNNHELGLLNGSSWTVDRCIPNLESMTAKIDVVSTEDDHDRVECETWLHHFMGREEELFGHSRRNHDEFAYGFAITAHSSQGSQYDDVIVFDESKHFGKEVAPKHLYTAITRAAKTLTVVI